jgi:hypothetical protein
MENHLPSSWGHGCNAFRGRRLGLQQPSGAAALASSNLAGKAMLHKIETPTKHQGLQGVVFKKIATWTPPPPTPTKFRFSPEETLAFRVWEVSGSPTMKEGITTHKDVVIAGTSRRPVQGFRSEHRHPMSSRGSPGRMSQTDAQHGLHRRPPTLALTTSAAAPHTVTDAPHRSINDADEG